MYYVKEKMRKIQWFSKNVIGVSAQGNNMSSYLSPYFHN